jgi:hypothetical protein
MTRVTNEDLKKNILKHRTEEDMRKALSDLIHQRHTLHVPPDSDDADMVLSDVIEEALELRKKLADAQIPRIPVISTPEELGMVIANNDQIIFMGNPSDTMQDIEQLRKDAQHS